MFSFCASSFACLLELWRGAWSSYRKLNPGRWSEKKNINKSLHQGCGEALGLGTRPEMGLHSAPTSCKPSQESLTPPSTGLILHNAHYMSAFQVLIPRETELGTLCSFIEFLRFFLKTKCFSSVIFIFPSKKNH